MTPAPRRHGKAPNPGERESVLDLLARANARGRAVPTTIAGRFEPACRACATTTLPTVNGVRVATPCRSCGAVRG